jgi:iron(III) transport system permease protein
VGAAVGGSLFAALISYVLIRSRFVGRNVLDFLCWLPWALHGVLLGRALLWVFVGNPALRVVYGTVWLLVLALIIAELPLGTQMLKAAIMQISKELEESAWMSGGSWWFTIRRVMVPLLLPSIVSVGLIVFISAVRDIPTLVFLSSAESRTLSLLMLDYIVSAQLERALILGVFVTAIIVVAALIGRTLGLRTAVARE